MAELGRRTSTPGSLQQPDGGLDFPGFSGHAAAFVLGLEVLGADTAEVAVSPWVIVERFDVSRYVSLCELSIPVDLLLDTFFLQAAEK